MPISRPLSAAALTLVLSAPSFAQDGTLDPTFSGDGRATVTFGRTPNDADAAWGIAVQPDGRAVLAGEACATSTDCRVATARLMPDGSFDPSFSADGRAAFAFGTSTRCEGSRIQVRPQDGKLVVAGQAVDPVSSSWRLGLARLTTSGLFDSTFGAAATPGSTLLALPGGTLDSVHGLALQPDGKILVGGFGYQGTSSDADYFVARFTATGQLDATFSGDGVVWIAFDLGGELDDELSDLALQADGKILVVGQVETGADDTDTGLVRLTSTGALDTTFDGDSGTGNGKVVWELLDAFGDQVERPEDVTLQPDGRILVAGFYSSADGTGFETGFFGRLTSNGASDPTLVLQFLNNVAGHEYASSILYQADGKLIVSGGTVAGATGIHCQAARFLANGTALDPTFGTGGFVVIPVPGAAAFCTAAVQSGAKVLLAGRTNSNTDFLIARLSSAIFRDGFETGNTSRWSASAP